MTHGHEPKRGSAGGKGVLGGEGYRVKNGTLVIT